MTGQRVKQFEILERVGAGGFGVVYKAWDTQLLRHVALKALHDDPTRGAASAVRDELLQEARMAARLEHPNIATVFEVFREDGVTYLAMQWVAGTTLRHLIGADRHSAAFLEHLYAQVARGLAAAHARDVVHRDIKPENILISQANEVKISDFGLSKAIDATQGPSGLQGTVPYLAPERLKGLPHDKRSDVFAAGAVFYELAAGVHPFRRETPAETLLAILEEPPRSLAALRPDLAPGLVSVVATALEKKPEDRYEDGGALLRAIEGSVEGRWPALEATTLRLAAPSRRRWVRKAALGAALAATILVAIRFGPTRSVPHEVFIAGQVIDEAGHPVANAQVTIDGYPFLSTTSSLGGFGDRAVDVRPGDSIVLRITHDEYETFTYRLAIGSADPDPITIELTPAWRTQQP